MSPRTNSPPPSSYTYDDINDYDYPSGPSTGGHQPFFNSFNPPNFNSSQYQQNNIPPNGTNLFRNDASVNSSRDNDEKGSFTALLLRPLNVSRRVLSSSAVKCVSLVVLYSFCLATLCFIFFVSYFLTLYDDARRLFRSSRVWARLKNGVRDRISMMGDDWEDFFQQYFDQPWDGVDVNRNGHLGGGGGVNNNNNNNNNNNGNTAGGATNDAGSKRNPNESGIPTDNKKIPSAKDLEWLKGAMLGFIAVVAGQDTTNQFQQSANSFRNGGDAGRR